MLAFESHSSLSRRTEIRSGKCSLSYMRNGYLLNTLFLFKVPVKELVLSGKEQILDAKPSTAEYAGEATKQFLDVLESVGDLIPVPGFPTAVKIAKSIMQACDVSGRLI